MFSYLTYDESVNKKVKFSKKCLIKQKIKFPRNYRNCLDIHRLEKKINSKKSNNEINIIKENDKEFLKK